MIVPSGFGLEVDAQACGLATRRHGSRHRAAGVRGRRLELPTDHVTVLDGTWLTTPARTWLDCAALVSWRDVVAMGDALLRAQLADPDELLRMVDWGRRRRGIRFARAALEILDPGAESPGESWVRALLARTRLPRPDCNLDVIVDGFTFRLDIAWRHARVAMEYDGVEFHGADRADHDRWRRELLRAAGWTVIVVTRDDLRDGDGLVRQAREALMRARSGLSTPCR
jgi:very-short-patch-repair endonuclease